MASPFSPIKFGPSSWSLVPQAPLPSSFFPFPSLGQAGTQEVGYGEGGYGEDGYDTPSIPGSFAPSTLWTVYTLK